MRILISDHHEASACGCEAVVRALDKDAEILRVIDRSDVLTIAGKHSDLDLILWHVHDQPGEDMEILKSLSRFAVGVPIVVFADRASPDNILSALKFGAKGYVDLPAKKDLLVAILRLILAGECYCPTYVLREEGTGERMSPPQDSSVSAEQRPLTARQKEVFQLLEAGHSNREIADRLGIAPATAKLHVAAVLKAVSADERSALISDTETRRSQAKDAQ